jgi:hypothetical protein
VYRIVGIAGRSDDAIHRRVDARILATKQQSLRRDVARDARGDQLLIGLGSWAFDQGQAHT